MMKIAVNKVGEWGFNKAMRSKQNDLRTPTEIATLGDPTTGNVDVAGKPGYVYANISGIVAEVYNPGKVAPQYGLPVIIGRDPYQPNFIQVISERNQNRATLNGGSFGVGGVSKHAPSHRWPGGDTVWIERRQLMPLRPSVLGWNLQVHEGLVQLSTGITKFPITTLDLSSYQATTPTKARAVLVYINDSNVLTALAGPEVNFSTFTPLDTPAAPYGCRARVCSVRFYYGQTALIDLFNNSDLIDLRFVEAPFLLNFIELNDVPHSYTSYGGDFVRVKLAEDGLEFAPAELIVPPAGPLLWLSDVAQTTPTAYTLTYNPPAAGNVSTLASTTGIIFSFRTTTTPEVSYISAGDWSVAFRHERFYTSPHKSVVMTARLRWYDPTGATYTTISTTTDASGADGLGITDLVLHGNIPAAVTFVGYLVLEILATVSGIGDDQTIEVYVGSGIPSWVTLPQLPGGAPGHRIMDKLGNYMPQQPDFQVVGSPSAVTNDAVNNRTVLTISDSGHTIEHNTSVLPQEPVLDFQGLDVHGSDSAGVKTIIALDSIKDVLTAKGSEAVASGANAYGELTVGTDFYYRRANSGAPLGQDWAPFPTGTGATVLAGKLLNDVTCTAGQASVTITPPSDAYAIEIYLRGQGADTGAGNDKVLLSYNGDTTASHYWAAQHYAGDTLHSFDSQNKRWIMDLVSSNVGRVNPVSSGKITIELPGSSLRKAAHSEGGLRMDNSGNTYVECFYNVWDNTAPITSIVLSTDSGSGFAAGTRIVAFAWVTQAIQSQTAIKTITVADSPYTALAADEVILCDAVGGAITVNLPAAASATGQRYSINKIDASAYAVTIDGNGSETINGSLTQLVSIKDESLTIVCNGTAWYGV